MKPKLKHLLTDLAVNNGSSNAVAKGQLGMAW